jgi:hypothetical protein
MPQAPAQTQQAPGPAGRGAGAAPGGGQGGRGGNPAPVIPPELEGGPIMKLDEAKALAMLKDPKSSYFQKAIACKRLAVVGKKESIAPLAALLSDPKLAHYGRFGLEPNPDPAVDDALRAALPKLKGRLQMGVIHSIGVRKDVKAIDALGKLMYDSDAEIAQAASASLGTIGGPQAGKLLREGLNKAQGTNLAVVARAALLCVESIPNRTQAMEMYNALAGTNMPKVVRRAAYRAINADAARPRPA